MEAAPVDSTARVDLLTCRSRGSVADRAMAGRCWDLGGLPSDHAEFVDRLVALPPHDELARMPGREVPAAADRARVLLPHLPLPRSGPAPESLPEGWPGRRAHELFVDAHVRSVLERHSG